MKQTVLLLWQQRPLPSCETPALYRAAWCIDPPAVHIGHGGCPEHRAGRSKAQNNCGDVFSNIAEGWTDSPRVSQSPQENRGVSCSLAEPAKVTKPTIRIPYFLTHTMWIKIKTTKTVVLRWRVRLVGLCAARGRTSNWEQSCWPEGDPGRRTRRCELLSPCESPGWFLKLRS